MGVLIAAAGSGERAGGGVPKQFRPIAGVPMLLRAIGPFARHPAVRQIVVALPAGWAEHPPPWLAEVAGERLRLVAGGDTRLASVRAALAALHPACAVVLVHDAARPFVAADTIEAVIATAAGGTGAVPAVPVCDTLKRTGPTLPQVEETVDRRHLWRAQTPQGFPRMMLEHAYTRLGAAAPAAAHTDDAAVVEAAGFPVEVIADRESNIKVTTPDDFRIAEALAGA